MRINEITQEQKVNIKCLISKCDKGKTVKDTPYLSLILEDATGVLDAKFWNLTNEQIEQYIADIVFATRYPDRYGLADLKDMITFGGSPRASISLAKAARAYAFIKHRGYVVPEDVRAVAHDVLRHRIGLSYEAEASDVTSEEIVSRIINKVEVP